MPFYDDFQKGCTLQWFTRQLHTLSIYAAKVAAKVAKDAVASEAEGAVASSHQGIVNLGVSCYAGAIMQVLFSAHNFSKPCFSDLDVAVATSDALKDFHMVLQALGRGGRGEAVSMTSELAYITDESGEYSLQLNYQHCAQEYLIKLLGHIEQFPNPYRANVSLFAASVQSTFECTLCKVTTSPKPARTLNIQLHLPDDLPELGNSLVGLVGRHFNSNDTATVTRNCSNCAGTISRETLKLVEAPQYMTFHLVRMRFNNQNGVATKIDREITVEETLDMSAYCDVEMPAAKYKLRAIVHHIGTSCDQGHYIADVTTADGKFWRCNDADVTQIAQLGGIQLGNSGRPRRECAMPVRNNVTKKTPYLVIYQKT